MAFQTAEIVCRGKGEEGADALPLRLPVEGVSLELLAEALLPLHLTCGPGTPRSSLQSAVPHLRCRTAATPGPIRRPAARGGQVLPLITRHDSGDTLELAGGTLRLRPAGGDTISCPPDTLSHRRGPFPLLLEMAVIHALALEGIPVFHGAGFAIGGEAVLALGHSGVGKTTLAAAAIRGGGKVISDDSLIAWRRRSGAIAIQPFRRDLQVRQGSRRLFPRAITPLLDPLTGAVEPKWILRREAAASCFTDDVSLSRIWILSLDRRLRRCRIRPLNQAEALVALIQGSSPLYLSGRYPREQAALMPLLRALVEQVPAYGVRLGRALLEEPVAELERLLAFHGA